MFPKEIRAIILDYAAIYTLVSWVDDCGKKINWKRMARNPNGIDLMIANPRKARWGLASSNPSAFYHLRDNLPSLIDYKDLATSSNNDAVTYAIKHYPERYYDNLLANPSAIEWITANPPDSSQWWDVLRNPAAEELLRAHGILEKLPRDDTIGVYDIYSLCQNPSEWAMKIVAANLDKIMVGERNQLSENPSDLAIDIMAQLNLVAGRHSWPRLSANTNPRVVARLIAENEIYWPDFSANPAAYEHLKANPNKVDYNTIWSNPRIFKPRWPEGVFDLL